MSKFICPICKKKSIVNKITQMVECSDKNCHVSMTIAYALLYGQKK